MKADKGTLKLARNLLALIVFATCFAKTLFFNELGSFIGLLLNFQITALSITIIVITKNEGTKKMFFFSIYAAIIVFSVLQILTF